MTALARPGRFWTIGLVALLGMAVTARLGWWQLDRAAQREAAQAQLLARQHQAPLNLNQPQALVDLPAQLHRPALVRGHWLRQHTVYLDNRQMGGRPGFYVLTPLQPEGQSAWLLVQRGWVPRNFIDRERLPEFDTPQGVVELHGQLAPPPARLYALAAEQPGAIRQNLDLAAFSVEIGHDLMSLSLVQSDPSSGGLLRDWPQPGAGAAKNYGYAFQWFGLCGLIALLYVWFQLVRPYLVSRRPHP